jgi:signal transduction histidine kinase
LANLVLLPNHKPRLGLLGMRERVEMVGGTFTIESIPGKGTTVHTELPFGGAGGKPDEGTR